MRSKKLFQTALIIGCVSTSIFVTSCDSLSKRSYPLVATGQVDCYDLDGKKIAAPKPGDKLYGQDGNYQAGLAMAYKDNGDGTVTDLNTGLMWEQTPEAGPVTWGQAEFYCTELTLGGYDDWRLPTLKELFSISDFSTGWPYINTLFFNLSGNGMVEKDEQYWASEKYVGTTVEGRDNAAFGVNHATGHIKAYPAGNADGSGGRQQRPEGQERPEGQDGERPQRTEGQSGERPQRSEGQSGQSGERRERPAMAEGQGGQGEQGGQERGQRTQQRQEGQGGTRAASADGETTRPQRGLRTQQQGGTQPAGERPEGQSGERPQRAEGQSGERSQMARGQMMGGNPMQKRVRAVRGEVYGENKFVDNGDGTITDKATGLMWAKDDNGKGIEWVEAVEYAESSTLAGHDDWRLPNIKELQSIVDYRYAPSSKELKPAIDPMFNCTPFVNRAGNDDFGYYWSGTSAIFRKGTPYKFAWYVAFGRAVNREGADMHGAGAVRFDTKSDDGSEVEGGEQRYYNFVRPVRALK